MLRLFFIFLLVLSAAALPVSSLSAQESTLLDNGLFESLLPEIQDELLAEADRVNQECVRKGTYASFHDCDCIASRFFEERLTQGPEVNHYTLLGSISRECVNEPAIAGSSYDYCMTKIGPLSGRTRNLNNAELDEHCRCFARTMARTYKNAPHPHYRYIVKLRTDSMKICSDARHMVAE